MSFKFQQHVRLAGVAGIILGLFTQNWNIVVFGWTLVACAYMVSIGKIERYIEGQSEEDK